MIPKSVGCRVLYTSDQIREAIKRLFSETIKGDRRVAMVAYVGGAADTYLRDPKALEIVCSLQPGSTSSVTLGRLKRRGAVLYQSDRLHMKVYWSSRKGCVIGSANASGNALGGGGLKEAGVWLPPGTVDIETLWTYANPRPISKTDLKKLAASDPPRNPGQKQASDATAPDFREWTKIEGGLPWKLGWWRETGEIAKNARDEARTRFGVTSPNDAITAAKRQIKEGDWLLSFDIDTRVVRNWFRADLVVDVASDDQGAYTKKWPYQAVMLHSRGSYGPPPFRLDKYFREAFADAVQKFGAKRIVEGKSLVPTAELLQCIEECWPDAR